MPKLTVRSHAAIRSAVLGFAVLQLAACSSQEDRARDYYEHGMKLLSENGGAKAAIELRNAVRLKRDMIEAWKALVEIDETNRNWPGVVTDLRTIVELTPSDASARLRLGKLLLLAGSADEALRSTDAGIDLDNRNADLHALKAAISFRMDNRTEAVREAQTALDLDPANLDALMVLAIERLGSGDAKGALSILESSSAAGSTYAESNLGLQLLKIRLFGQTGDLKSVESAFKKLIELNPQEPQYRKLLINFYVEQHRIAEAEKEMRELAAATPADAAAVLDLVRFLYTIKKSPDAARQELDTRIRAGGEIFPFQLALAKMDFSEDRLTDGKELLDQLISTARAPDQVRAAKIALAQMYLNKRDFDPAEGIVTDVLSVDAHDVSALKLRASIRMARGQLEEAVTDLLDALNHQPRSTELMLLLATAYERSGLIELAEKQFSDATRASDYSANVVFDYAAFLERRGSIGRAEDMLVGLNKRRPNDVRILSRLAELRLARQNWTGAEEVAQSIRKIGNTSAAGQILGTALIGRNKFDDAIAAFQNAYDAAPDAAQPMSSLVGALLKADKKQRALDFLKSALAKNPKNGTALVLLGTVQLASGAADEATKNFLAAIEAQPKDAAGYEALANLYINQKKYDDALKVVQHGVEQQPDGTGLRMILATILERKEDYDAAISQYEIILAKQPDNLIAANNLASLLLDHRADQASLKKAQTLAAFLRKTEIPQFKDTLGWASYHQGDYKAAVSLSEEAAAALPEQAAVRYHLGMSYLAGGQPAKASEQLKRALELTQDNELADEIHAALKKTGS